MASILSINATLDVLGPASLRAAKPARRQPAVGVPGRAPGLGSRAPTGHYGRFRRTGVIFERPTLVSYDELCLITLNV